MPSYPQPVGRNGNVPVIWNWVQQTLMALAQQVAALVAAGPGGNLVDQYGNTVEVAAVNVSQTVTIGATATVAGVQVMTGVTGAGRAVQQALATGTITTTKGSAIATLDMTTSGTFTNGQVIGAADVTDPSSGVATPAIVPGTTFTISGSTVTLSQDAAESGTAIYCAACFFRLTADFTYP